MLQFQSLGTLAATSCVLVVARAPLTTVGDAVMGVDGTVLLLPACWSEEALDDAREFVRDDQMRNSSKQ